MKTNKCSRIRYENLGVLAAQGVARALEARKTAGIDLTADEIAQVSGGVLSVARPIDTKPGIPRIPPWGFHDFDKAIPMGGPNRTPQ